MGGKTSYLSVPTAQRSQAMDALSSIVNARNQDSRQQLISDREAKRYALQVARENRLEAKDDRRYKDGLRREREALARKDQALADSNAGLIAGLSTQLDVPTSKTVSVDADPFTTYDTANGKENDLTTYIQSLDKQRTKVGSIGEDDKAFIDKYDEINKETDIIKKKRLLLQFAKDNGFKDTIQKPKIKEKVSDIGDMYSTLLFGDMEGTRTGYNAIKSKIKDYFTPKTEEDIINEESVKAKKDAEPKPLTADNYIEQLRERAAKINTAKTKNQTLRDANKKIDFALTPEQLAEKGFLKKSIGYKGKENKDYVMTPSEYAKSSASSVKKAIKDLDAKKLTPAAYQSALVNILKRKNQLDASFKTERATEIKRLRELAVEARKSGNARKLALIKARLKAQGEEKKFNREANSAATRAKIALEKAQTAKYNRDK